MYVADHPRLLPRARRQLLTLDAAIPDEAVLRAHIESRLGIDVRHVIVQELDFVRDLTVVDVRYRVPTSPAVVAADGHPTAGLDLPASVGRPPVAGDLLTPSNAHGEPERRGQNHTAPAIPTEAR